MSTESQVDEILKALEEADSQPVKPASVPFVQTTKAPPKFDTNDAELMKASYEMATLAFEEAISEPAKSQYLTGPKDKPAFNFELYAEDEGIPTNQLVVWWNAYIAKRGSKAQPIQSLHLTTNAVPAPKEDIKRDFRTTPAPSKPATMSSPVQTSSPPAQAPTPVPNPPSYPILTPRQRLENALKDYHAEYTAKDARIRDLERQVADLQTKLAEASEATGVFNMIGQAIAKFIPKK